MKTLIANCIIVLGMFGLSACNGGGGSSGGVNQVVATEHTNAATSVARVANQCLNASDMKVDSSSSVWYMSGSFKVNNSCAIAQSIAGTSILLSSTSTTDIWLASSFTVNSFSPWLGNNPNISTSSSGNKLTLTINNSYSLAKNSSIKVNFGYSRNNTKLTMPIIATIDDGSVVPTPTPSPNPVPTPSPTPKPTPSPVPSPAPIAVPDNCLNNSNLVLDQNSAWWMSGSFNIQNNCATSQNLNGLQVLMTSNNANDTLVAGSFQLNSTSPFIAGLTINTSNVGKALQLIINTNATIAANATLKVSFGYNPNGIAIIGPLSVSNNSIPPVANATIVVAVNSTSIASVCKTATPCNIQIMLSSQDGQYNKQVTNITSTTGSTSYNMTGLVAGTYTVSANNLPINILANYNPNSVINLAAATTANTSVILSIATVNPTQQKIVGYYETWAGAYASLASNYSLAKIPAYVNSINLAFAKPDAVYTAGSFNFSNTGLEIAPTGQVFADAIKVAQAKGQKVLLSVGGATYPNFAQINIPALMAIVKDLNLNGIDIDYETSSAGCSNINTNNLSCPTDGQLVTLVTNLRNGLDGIKSGLTLTAAIWSIGAYGTPQFPTTTYLPYGSMSGIWVNPLKQVGNKFDELYLMSYDAGNITTTGYDPISSLKAYKALTSKPIYIGIEVPPEAWGGNVTTPTIATNLATQAQQLGGAGIMIWALQLQGMVSGTTYNATNFLQPICNLYYLGNSTLCNQVVPTN